MRKVVWDIETGSVDDLWDYDGNYVRLAGYQINDEEPVLTTDIDRLIEVILSADRHYTVNGIAFDCVALALYHGADYIALTENAVDLMIVERQIDPPSARGMPRGYYGLDQMCHRYKHEGKSDDLKGLAKKHGGFDKIPIDDPQYRRYTVGDINATRFLAKAIGHHYEEDPYIRREHDVMRRMTYGPRMQGFRVDEVELDRRLVEQAERKEKNFQILEEEWGIPRGRWKHYKSKPDVWQEFSAPLRTTEGKQALEEALQSLGVTKMRRTDRTRDIKTSKEDLEAAIEFYSDAEKVRKKGMEPLSKENLEAFVELCNLVIDVTTERTVYNTIKEHTHNGKVHPKIAPKQASGRWSVQEPGLTVMGKRGGKYYERGVLQSDNEDEVLIAVDMDQVDARVVAGLCQDPAYMALFAPGKDLHSEVAMRIFGRCDGEFRDNAKVGAHGYSYGMGARGLSEQMGVEYDVAERFIYGMRTEFPILARWRTQVKELAEHGMILDNGFGRKMRPDPERAATQGPGLKGQGGTRDLMAEWILRLPMKYVKMLRVVIHDEGVFSVPKKDWEKHAKVILEAATMEFHGVPITAGCSKPGRSWAQVYEK